MRPALAVVRAARRDETELQQRAKNNVEDDLRLLLDIAQTRAQHSNKRLRLLGEYERALVQQLMKKLETL